MKKKNKKTNVVKFVKRAREEITPDEIAELIFKGYIESEAKGKEVFDYLLENSSDLTSRFTMVRIHGECLDILRNRGMKI